MTAPWPDGATFDAQGLSVAGVRASDLAGRHGTPLVVVDEAHLRERCRAFVGAFGRVLWAVKAFPAGGLIRVALEEGLGLLAATDGELKACLRAGARGERLAFHGNNKSDAEIDLAVGTGVSLLIVDNEEELDRVAEAASRHGTRQPVLLRVAPGIDVDTHAYVATGMADTKFGIPEPFALRAFKTALSLPTLDVRGLHLHLGSQLFDAQPYLASLDVAVGLLGRVRDELGFEARTLDVGGGMGVAYTDERPMDLGALSHAVGDRLAERCAAAGIPVPELIVEPGRAVTSNAAVTVYTVGVIKEIPGVRTFASVDGGMSDNVRPALYGSRYTMALGSRASGSEGRPYTVVGRHCETGDTVARDVQLPGDIRRGDLLAVASTGAYEYAMSSNYNKVGRPAVVLVGGGGDRLILRREDLGDLDRLEMPARVRPPSPRPSGVEVRPGRSRDARGTHRLTETVAAEGRYIRSEHVRWSVRQMRRRFRTAWTKDRAELVAVVDGRVIGHLGIGRETHPVTAHVASLGMVVAADHRGRGVGSALMAAAFDWARWAGVEKLSLSVYPHNTAAVRLYRAFGFVDEGRLVRHSKKSTGYDDEVIMGAWV